MLSEGQKEELKRFFQALDDRPLPAGDAKYVPELHQSPGHKLDPVEDYIQRLEWSDRNFSSMITGQPGAGKSTELLRLKYRLETAGHLVFLIDLGTYLNPNEPLEITDFLLTVLGALGDAIQEKLGMDMIRESYWERCRNLMARETKLELSVKTGAELKASLKDDPSFKRRVQNALKDSFSSFLNSVKNFVESVVSELEIQTRRKSVVVLIDSLEKVKGIGEDGRKVHESIRNLFVENSRHLVLPGLNMVYSVPAYLAFLAPSVNTVFGGTTWSLANGHVYKKSSGEIGTDPVDDIDPVGLEVMRGLINKRYAKWPEVLLQEDLDRCILATGGDLRDLFRMLRQVLLAAPRLDSLPVPTDLIEEVENQLRREMLPLTEDDKSWLRKIYQTKDCHLSQISELDRLARFFTGKRVQCYRNGSDWYDVHPLLRPELKAKPAS